MPIWTYVANNCSHGQFDLLTMVFNTAFRPVHALIIIISYTPIFIVIHMFIISLVIFTGMYLYVYCTHMYRTLVVYQLVGMDILTVSYTQIPNTYVYIYIAT